jgi:hypothetical protein
MNEFEIINSVKECSKSNRNILHSLTDNNAIEKKISVKARMIIRSVNSKQQFNNFQLSDISNEIVEGREVVVSNKIINRSHILFSELMNKVPISGDNINLSIVYACHIAIREYIKTWQDKQFLVLTILRKYTIEHTELLDQNSIHVILESHIPIILEKIIHPEKKRFSIKSLMGCCI